MWNTDNKRLMQIGYRIWRLTYSGTHLILECLDNQIILYRQKGWEIANAFGCHNCGRRSMNLHELTAREFNAIADAVMVTILVIGAAVGVFGEICFYRRARKKLAQTGKLHHYWWLMAAMLSIFVGTVFASAILPGGDWESRWAMLIFMGVLLAVIALLRAALMKGVNRSE